MSSLPMHPDCNKPCGNLLAASGPRILFFFPICVGNGRSYFRFFSYQVSSYPVSHCNMFNILTSFLSFFCPAPPGCWLPYT